MDIICFCHLRWNFVYQRPQHLLTRFAQHFRVFVVEEPVFNTETSYLEITLSKEKVWVIVPHIVASSPDRQVDDIEEQRGLLKDFFEKYKVREYIAWYYSPMALPIGNGLPTPDLIIYDCMDELSAFSFAPSSIKENEVLLLKKADLVFTGGHSLYEAKKHLHSDIYPFPSSIDKIHFGKSRLLETTDENPTTIGYPRIGFFGVIDERFDLNLLSQIAILRPAWQFIIIGPIVKIDPATLPQGNNIHYTGQKTYEQLPHFMTGWDVAIIPFANNESTRYISPTKTPEYLAGGLPVVSTPINDIIKSYGKSKLVYIADTPEDFVKGIEWGIKKKSDPQWREEVDEFLADISWENTWKKMMTLLEKKILSNQITKENKNQYV
ncbi:MAG: glycosyl transferase [Chitinophagaceae bacterium]|nr:glycosyl transferase [Chitinophagaceae bacterium]